MAPEQVRDVLRSASMRRGEPSASMAGMSLTLVLCADSWDTLNSVSSPTALMPTTLKLKIHPQKNLHFLVH